MALSAYLNSVSQVFVFPSVGGEPLIILVKKKKRNQMKRNIGKSQRRNVKPSVTVPEVTEVVALV